MSRTAIRKQGPKHEIFDGGVWQMIVLINPSMRTGFLAFLAFFRPPPPNIKRVQAVCNLVPTYC